MHRRFAIKSIAAFAMTLLELGGNAKSKAAIKMTVKEALPEGKCVPHQEFYKGVEYAISSHILFNTNRYSYRIMAKYIGAVNRAIFENGVCIAYYSRDSQDHAPIQWNDLHMSIGDIAVLDNMTFGHDYGLENTREKARQLIDLYSGV